MDTPKHTVLKIPKMLELGRMEMVSYIRGIRSREEADRRLEALLNEGVLDETIHKPRVVPYGPPKDTCFAIDIRREQFPPLGAHRGKSSR